MKSAEKSAFFIENFSKKANVSPSIFCNNRQYIV